MKKINPTKILEVYRKLREYDIVVEHNQPTKVSKDIKTYLEAFNRNKLKEIDRIDIEGNLYILEESEDGMFLTRKIEYATTRTLKLKPSDINLYKEKGIKYLAEEIDSVEQRFGL